MIKYEYLLELEKRLKTKYEKEVIKGMVIHIDQTDKRTYQGYNLWMLKAQIGFQEGVGCEILWGKKNSGFSMDFIVSIAHTKGIGKEGTLKKQCSEIDKLILYYDMGKEVFLDWIKTVPELRLLYVLSPGKVLKETENIKKYKTTFVHVKGSEE